MMNYNPRILKMTNPIIRAWMKYIWRDVNRDKFGFFADITGPPSSGKTLTNMALMFLQDTTFTPDTIKDRITRKPRDFIRTLNELDRGQWMTMTDAGQSSSISSKNWMKLGNIIMEDVTQVQRIKRCGITLDVQVERWIDNRVRTLFQWHTEVKRFGSNPSVWKIHRVKFNQITNTIIYPHPVLKVNNRMFKLRNITMKGIVPKEYIRVWEELEVEFKDRIIKESYDRIERIEQEENPLTTWERIDKVREKVEDYTNSRGKVDADLIMLKMNVGRSEAAKIVKFLRKEGK